MFVMIKYVVIVDLWNMRFRYFLFNVINVLWRNVERIIENVINSYNFEMILISLFEVIVLYIYEI